MCCIYLQMFCFGLETRVIIKILTQETLTNFHGDKAKKKKKFEKKIKNGRLKKFQVRQFLIVFRENFRDWTLD
jgi:hypothetical protein